MNDPTSTPLAFCGHCLNCRNGYPQLCLERRQKSWPKARAEYDSDMTLSGKWCNACGASVPKGRRFCDACRDERRRETWRKSQNTRRDKMHKERPPEWPQDALCGAGIAATRTFGHFPVTAITVDRMQTERTRVNSADLALSESRETTAAAGEAVRDQARTVALAAGALEPCEDNCPNL